MQMPARTAFWTEGGNVGICWPLRMGGTTPRQQPASTSSLGEGPSLDRDDWAFGSRALFLLPEPGGGCLGVCYPRAVPSPSGHLPAIPAAPHSRSLQSPTPALSGTGRRLEVGSERRVWLTTPPWRCPFLPATEAQI